MSIQSEIDRLISVRNELRVALQNKGATLTDGAVLADFVGAVNNLSIGSDIDFTGVNVSAGSMLKDVVAIGAGGTKVTGTIPNGSIQTPTVTFNNDELTFEVNVKGSKGYYDSAISKKFTLDATTAMESAVPELSLNFLGISGGEGDKAYVVLDMSTDTPGYLKSSWTLEESNTIPAVPYTVYTPGTEDQSISSDQWINGEQVIKGDSNLVAGNIKKGITIFNVTGTLEAESPELPEVSITADKLLTGYTALDSNGNVVSGSMPYSQQIGHEGGGFIVEYTAGYLPDGMRETAPSATITETDTAVTVGMGWVNQSKTFNKVVSGGGTDTSDGDAVGDDVVSGKVFYNKNGRQTGTMVEFRGALSELVIPAAANSDAEAVTATLTNLSPGERSWISSGGDYELREIASYPYTTHTPGTSDKKLEHGHWLSGDQIIKGDSNLKAANIKKGVSIFGVNGSLETSSGSTGGGSFVKVTEFIEPHDAYSAVSSLTVTGFGELDAWGDMIDYSEWNGTYQVTPDTATESELDNRVFKHTSSNKYIYKMYDSEWGAYMWVFAASTTASSIYEAAFFANELDANYWNNYEYDLTAYPTIVKNTTNYPAQELVLSAATATYNNGWVIGSSTSISAYDRKPLKHGIYTTMGGKLIGEPVAYHADMYMPQDGLLAYFPMDDSGNFAVDVVSGTVLYARGKGLKNAGSGIGKECLNDSSFFTGSGDALRMDIPSDCTISAKVSCTDWTKRNNGQTYSKDICIVDFGSYENRSGVGIWANTDVRTNYLFGVGMRIGDSYEQTLVNGLAWDTSYLITFTYKATENEVACYVNGELSKSTDIYTPAVCSKTNQFPIIGMFSRAATQPGTLASGNWFAGTISEVMLWNRVLSAEEIATLVR
jgi:hypothetical protein